MAKRKARSAAVYRTPAADFAVAYDRDRHGNLQARVVGYRPHRRSWRYWRAVALALAVTAKRRLGRGQHT